MFLFREGTLDRTPGPALTVFKQGHLLALIQIPLDSLNPQGGFTDMSPSPEGSGLQGCLNPPRLPALSSTAPPRSRPCTWSCPGPASKAESLCILQGLCVEITQPQNFRTSVSAFSLTDGEVEAQTRKRSDLCKHSAVQFRAGLGLGCGSLSVTPGASISR